MDKFDRPTRSRIMASVRSKGNKSTEWRLRAFLIQSGISGWQVHASGIVGKPDFVFLEQKLAVFVNGCFWHMCPQCCRLPATKKQYWHTKIETNAKRDKLAYKTLRELGWSVIVVWEHELKTDVDKVINQLRRVLHAQ